MPNTVDRRVVEMRFDNKDFEKNIGKTMVSLETLEKALQMQNGQNGAEKVKKGLFGLGKAVEKIDTNNLANNVQKISDRFSTLGIIGATVLQNIGNRIANLAFDIKNKLLAPLNVIKQGGLTRALNLEQANFQIKGLGIEKNDTASYYTEVMDAVLGTAYSYDVAAKAASQLAASNVGVTEKSKVMLNGQKTTAKYFNGDMTKAILGIAGVASMTGSSFDDISQVFTRVAGQGKVMSNDLNSISARGLNAAATLANYLGKTEAEVRDMVTKGEIDFNTFSAAMTEAFGEHAKDSTKTFTGALEDVKAALSRIGADFYGPYLTAARDILNSMTPIVDLVHDKIQPALDLAGDSMLKYSKKATGVIDTFSLAGNTLTDSLGNKLSPSISVVKKGVSSLDDSMKELKHGSDEVYTFLAKELNTTSEKAKKMAEEGAVSYTTWATALQKFVSSGKEGSDEVRNYLADLSSEMKRYENVADNLGITQAMMGSAFKRFAKIMGTDVNKVYEAVGEKVGKTGEELKKAVKDGTFSLTDFRGALVDLQKDGAITSEQFHQVIDIMDEFILTDNKLSGALSKFSYFFGKQFNDVFKAGKDIVLLFRDAFKGLIDVISGGGGESALFSLAMVVSQFIAFLARGISRMIEFGRTSGAFKKVHDALLVINDTLFGWIDALSYYGSNVTEIFSDLFKTLSSIGGKISSGIGKVFSIFDGKSVKVIEGIGKALSFVATTLSTAFSQLDFSGIGGLLAGGGIIAASSKLTSFIDILTEKVEKVKSGKGLVDSIKETLSGLGEAIEEFQKTLKVQQLKVIATSIAILAGACLVLSSIPVKKLGASVAAIGGLMLELTIAANSMKGGKVVGIVKLAAAILLLSFAVKQLSGVENLGKGLGGVLGLLLELLLFFKAMNKLKIKDKGLKNITKSMISLAIALALLSIPVKVLGGMDISSLVKGISGVGAMMVGLCLAAKSFSKIDPSGLGKAARSMLVFGLAINLLVIPIEVLGHTDIKSLGKGLGSIAAVMISMGIAAKALEKIDGTGFLKAAGAMVVIGIALNLLVPPLVILGSLALKSLAKGAGALGVVLLELAVAMHFMKDSIAGAGAMIIAAGALMIMAPALALLGSMSLEQIGKGLLAVAGALIVLGGAAALMGAFWTVMLPGVAILTLLSIAALALGAGMNLLAIAFSTGTAAIVNGVTSLAATLPVIFENLALAIGTFMDTLVEQLPKVIPVLDELFRIFIAVCIKYIPEIINVGLLMIVRLLEGIRSKISDITNIAIDIIILFVNTIGSRVQDVVDAGFNLMINFINGLADSIATNGPILIDSIKNLVASVLEVIAGEIPIFGDYAAKAIADYRKGLDKGGEGAKKSAKKTAEGVEKNLKVSSKFSKESTKPFTDLTKAIEKEGKNSSKKAKTAADDASKNLKIKSQTSNGSNAVAGIVSGMNSQIPALRRKSAEIARIVDDTVRKKNQIHSPSRVLARTGKYLIQGLINGVDSMTGEYQRKADNIATTLISSTNGAIASMNSLSIPNFNLTSAIAQSSDVNLRMNDVQRENAKLANGISALTKTLDSMTESMNSRALNNYITIDGSGDPEAFADDLIRSFRLNARTI